MIFQFLDRKNSMSDSDTNVLPAQQPLLPSLVVHPVVLPVCPLVPFALFAGSGGMLVAAAVVTMCSSLAVNGHPLYSRLSSVGKYYVGPKP